MDAKTTEHMKTEQCKILALSGKNQRSVNTPIGGIAAFCESEGLEMIVCNRYGHGGSDRVLATDGDRIVLIRRPGGFGHACGENAPSRKMSVEEIEEGQIRREFPFPVHETAHYDKDPISKIRNIRVVKQTVYADRRMRNQVMYESF